MPNHLSSEAVERYRRDGYVHPLPCLSPAETARPGGGEPVGGQARARFGFRQHAARLQRNAYRLQSVAPADFHDQVAGLAK